jgi:serine/threonine-protein kinase HipA
MKELRKAEIFANDELAGYLTQYENKYVFFYEDEYIKTGSPIGCHYPLTKQPFETEELPYFFLNLAPEGWMLNMLRKKHHIPVDDIFGILLISGREMVGAISIRPCSSSSSLK